ncbi:tyramine/octopamine receptor-like [Rhagoletis pomonella]|uniref:tyramine/octopamine receptor-like n=1 Tax=Rhagoletis pomonella TaxID=28610 RepID=UPI0017856E1D|nr:tyramine/octopamine receptor-like [Rhagoletis pomonella]
MERERYKKVKELRANDATKEGPSSSKRSRCTIYSPNDLRQSAKKAKASHTTTSPVEVVTNPGVQDNEPDMSKQVSYMDITAACKVAITNAKHPDAKLSEEEISLIRSLLAEMDKAKNLNVSLGFISSVVRDGWLSLTCHNKETRGWLVAVTAGPSPGADLKVSQGNDIPMTFVCVANVPPDDALPADHLMKRLATQKVAMNFAGSWRLGWVLCDIWISLDVLLCTASILSLCAISVDRYLAVTQPLTYSRKRRSKRLAFCMILIVWVLALAITCPPMLGWYEPGRRDLNECRYNQNEGYVIFSAMGSFFIPMAVMIYVYARISCVVASRHDHMADISVHNKKFKRYTAADVEADMDHDFSEQELSSGQRKHTAARTLSNPTLAKELHDMMLSEGESGVANATAAINGNGKGSGGESSSHCHSLLTLATANTKNSCYELTRPSSLKRTPTSSSTVTVITSGCGGASGTSGVGDTLNVSAVDSASASDQHWPSRTLSIRHHHHIGTSSSTSGISGNVLVGNVTTLPNLQPEAAALTRHTRIHHHHTKSFSNRVTSLKKENKTTQTLSIVVGGFIACWLPFFIYYLITPFLEEHEVSRTLAKGLTWLGWFNSAINPFIYAFYSVDFRTAFWRLTCKRFFSGSMKPQFPTNTMSIRR